MTVNKVERDKNKFKKKIIQTKRTSADPGENMYKVSKRPE